MPLPLSLWTRAFVRFRALESTASLHDSEHGGISQVRLYMASVDRVVLAPTPLTQGFRGLSSSGGGRVRKTEPWVEKEGSGLPGR